MQPLATNAPEVDAPELVIFVPQEQRSILKADAELSTSAKSVTDDMSHREMSSVNCDAPLKVPKRLLVLPTFQPLSPEPVNYVAV